MGYTQEHNWQELVNEVYLFLNDSETRVLSPFDLTTTGYRTLSLLDYERPVNLVSVSDTLLVSRSTITRLVDKLEARGLVAREIDPENRRAHLLTLTQAGGRLRQEAHAAHQRLLDAVVTAVSEDDLAQLYAGMTGMRRALQAQVREMTGS